MKLIIKGGTIIDGLGNPPVEDTILEISGNKITKIDKTGKMPIPSDSQVIDANDMMVMPGMMDLHVHLGAVTNDPGEPAVDLATWKAPIQLRTMYAYRDALKYLEAGFTTVRDPGGYEVEIGVKKAIQHEIVKGPRIVVYKSVNETGADACRKKVREAILNDVADGIKVMTSGSVSGYIEDITWRVKTFE